MQGLKEKGLEFNVSYSRLPFFLRQGEETVKRWLVDELELKRDVSRGEAISKAFGGPRTLEHMEKLFSQAGVGPCYWESQFADTMDSHRLAWYAATESPEKGELMWKCLSRRYFEGKDTKIQPIRLDNHAMLMECAEEVGLDLEKARQVLDSDKFQREILDVVHQMHSVGIHSIPVLVFEVDEVSAGTWLQNPNSKGRVIHHGSGHKDEFTSILQKLHKDCTA